MAQQHSADRKRTFQPAESGMTQDERRAYHRWLNASRVEEFSRLRLAREYGMADRASIPRWGR